MAYSHTMSESTIFICLSVKLMLRVLSFSTWLYSVHFFPIEWTRVQNQRTRTCVTAITRKPFIYALQTYFNFFPIFLKNFWLDAKENWTGKTDLMHHTCRGIPLPPLSGLAMIDGVWCIAYLELLTLFSACVVSSSRKIKFCLQWDAISISSDLTYPELTANCGELSKWVFWSYFDAIVKSCNVSYMIMPVLPVRSTNHVRWRSRHVRQRFVKRRYRAITEKSLL